MTCADFVANAAARLEAAGLSSTDARQDAAVLARHALNWDLAHWLAHQRDEAGPAFAPAFNAAIARRAKREPVAYITGEKEFYGRTFAVSPAVLIPRPETELIIEQALRTCAPVHQCTSAPAHLTICDIGTGSGCLAITLALELPNAHVVATDLSPEALDMARLNALSRGAADRIEFREGAFLAGSNRTFDLIVSNPPYVADADRATLALDVVAHEPATALFSGDDGLDCIRELVRLAPARLTPGGTLIFEFGFGQAEGIRSLVAASELKLSGIRNDLQGIPRVAIATL